MREESALYDLAVVGAGPGGTTAAALARQRGWKVILFEKERFPRFRIGESLLPSVNGILKRSGAWDRVRGAGFYPKYGGLFHTFDGAATQELDFQCGLMPGLDHTYQVERARFDQLLLDHAADLGAEIRMETRVEQVEPIGNECRLQVASNGGTSTARARWVFDAGGRLNAMGSGEKRELDPPRFPRRVAVYSHVTGAARAEGRGAGHTVIVRVHDGWFWLIPLDAKRTSVGLVESIEGFKAAGQKPAERFWSVVSRNPKLCELLEGAESLFPFETTSDYSYFRRRLATRRVLRVGDAAGFFDPIFSSGIYVSLASAEMAVETVAAAGIQRSGLSLWATASYTRKVKRHARTFERLIAAFYDDPSFETFMSPEIPFNIRPGMTSIVAGHADLILPLWWRYWLFLAACRVQRYAKICPTLTPAPAG
ncbi:MAG TPA: NAD(P)/FAD-dependent oxidoreductase [Opitutaceae bacterium]